MAARSAADLAREAARLEATGQLVPAAALYRQALALEPLRPESWFLLGSCLASSGKTEEALQYLEKASLLAPGNAAYALPLAAALQSVQRSDEAIAIYERITETDPANVDAWTNLGVVLNESGDPAAALTALNQALALAPDDATVLLNHGTALLRLGRVDDAIDRFRAALERDPDSPEASSNLGFALQERLALEEALAAHRRAVALAPDRAVLRWNLAMTLLLAGDLAAGLTAFEARRDMPDRRPRPYPCPEWTGGDLAGCRLLVHAEQGIGDAIMVARYIPLLAARGAHVVFAVHTALAPLARTIPGVAEVVGGAAEPPPCDLQAPLLSLPLRFATTLETIPADVPYLAVPPGTSSPLPPPAGRRRIGLIWAGNPRHANDRNRSCPFVALQPLFSLSGIDWISLQVGERSGDPAATGARVADIAPALTDFAATAAAMAELDLVITVDTSTAHLAGALGRPVWILLPYAPDWRWLTARPDSPWYPTARLFRQTTPGDWAGVVHQVREALETVEPQSC